ncbi:MFS transporter [bacterium]|jgi:MFS transporter, DHA1 family, tetracycline resistance protein|nr:MFS transporter [bacterium]
MSQEVATKQSYAKPFLAVFAVVATELIGFGLIIPILPQIAFRYETNALLLGMLLAAYSFAQFIATPILGSLSDKYGRKPILLISKAGTVLSYLIMAFAPNYWILLLSRLMDGTTGGNISVARAYLADITAPEDRAKGMAVIGMAFGTGFIIGPGLGGVLFAVGKNHMVPALVAGAMSLLAFFLTAWLIKEPQTRKDKANGWRLFSSISILKKPKIALICVSYLIYMMLFSGFETTFSLFTQVHYGFVEHQNSMLYFYLGLIALVVQGFIARRAFKNLVVGVVLGFSIAATSYGLLSILPTYPVLIIGLAAIALGIGLVNTHLPALLSNEVPEGETGAIMGIYESFGSLSRIIGPLIIYASLFNHLPLAYGIFAGILMLLAVAFPLISKLSTR